MRIVIHENPGKIDPRSFSTFGINAKPNTASPIGYFGTGLKYAIAVLCRHGVDVTVWIGNEPHVFFTKTVDFRGSEIQPIFMRRKRGVTAKWMSVELPYTTQLGKNWELWQALRELHSNTLDENGRSFAVDPQDDDGTEWGACGPDWTRVVVQSDQYAEVFDRLHEIFLPEASSDNYVPGDPRVAVQVVDRPSKHVYYRGLRVMDLERPSAVTWNFNHPLRLTEDRTLSSQFMVEYLVKSHVKRMTDSALIRKILDASDREWEHSVDWSVDDGTKASDEFVGAAQVARSKSAKTFWVREMESRYHGSGEATAVDWTPKVLAALESDDQNVIGTTCYTYRKYLVKLLRSSTGSSDDVPSVSSVDDMPF